MTESPRVLITAEHASARFGGEAALPLHYFRVLRSRAVPVWLVTHARTRDELALLYPNDAHIVYIEDTAWHRAMWKIGLKMPPQISYVTTGFLSRLSTQFAQRRLVRSMVRQHAITVVHQPMPVSPREPSLMHDVGAPVVIGPMNGGMEYPPAFRTARGAAERLLLRAGRASAYVLNALMPGKRRATTLLVANRRTRSALPRGLCANVVEVVENGVDMTLWRTPVASEPSPESDVVTFAFMGRLVGWKAVDLLLHAFARARARVPMRLWILGDGEERDALHATASELGVLGTRADATGTVHFAGWLAQPVCVERLEEADCLVLPSLLECGGAVVLEAMSLAKPVIATSWGGPEDYLDPTCGILVPPVSREKIIQGFADAMVDMAGSKAARVSMGQAGLQKVRNEFDWEMKVDRMLEIYADAATRADPERARSPGRA